MTFVLIYGAGDSAWYWHLLESELRTPDEIEGGHCIALSRPKELADRLVEYAEKA